MKKTLLTLAVMCAAVSVMEAKVTLPHIFGDNMVLQQQTDVRFWGTAEPSSKVTIRPSWDRKASVAVFADADGKWQASARCGSAPDSPIWRCRSRDLTASRWKEVPM